MSVVTVSRVKEVISPPVKGLLSPLQANNIVLRLLIICIDPVDAPSLKLLSRFFTPQDYDDLVGERTITSRCGYPTCSNVLRDAKGKVRNPANQTVMPWQHSFCQLKCYQASQFYREQLKYDYLVTRKDVAFIEPGEMSYEQEIMLLPEVLVVAKERNKSVSETVVELIKDHRKLLEKLETLEIN